VKERKKEGGRERQREGGRKEGRKKKKNIEASHGAK
jgi:hypothetical protein